MQRPRLHSKSPNCWQSQFFFRNTVCWIAAVIQVSLVKVEHFFVHNHCLGWAARRWHESWLKRDQPARKLNALRGCGSGIFLVWQNCYDFAQAAGIVSGMEEALNGH
jgi:hypothetical protein